MKLHVNVNLPNFYTNLISYWQNLNVTVPPRKLDTLNQIIWNNRFIKIGKLSVFYESCHCAGIEKLSSFLDENECEFLTFNGFQQKFQLNCNFLQYYGLLSAIPKDWKDNYNKSFLIHMNPLLLPLMLMDCFAKQSINFKQEPCPPPPPSRHRTAHLLHVASTTTNDT